MNLQCVFHVSPATVKISHSENVRPPMPSMLDLDVVWDERPEPRGASIETWRRARGWASEE